MTGPERICVIGNSHLAAAKRGWEKVADHHPGRELTFFGAPWDMMGQLEVQDDALVPQDARLAKKLARSSEGCDQIRPSDYDRVILYGLQFGPRRVLQLYRNFRPVSFEWREPLPNLAPFKENDEPVQMVSERLFNRIALAGLADTLAVRIVEQIRALRDMPIMLVSAPGFSERVLETGDWDGPLGAQDLERLVKRIRMLLRRACPEGVQLIHPRGHLTRHGLFTAAAYAAPERSDETPDFVHTSPEYAAEMLSACLAAGSLSDRSAA